MKPVVRWGILGPGRISRQFVAGLREAEGAEVTAVGSRDPERAASFASEHAIPIAHGSYAALAAEQAVDAVYIGTPHPFHEGHAILCLRGGKHVLCEKPLALDERGAARMFAAADEADRLLMEAMWTRFLPSLTQVRRSIAEGRIGRPRMVTADLGFRAEFDPRSRLFDPALGGGALLDLGIYPLSLASMLFGEPERIETLANLGATGVDEEAAVLLHHRGGEIALLTASTRLATPCEARIQGTEGWIRIHSPWHASTRVTMSAEGGAETLNLPWRGGGYTHEAEAFMDLVRDGDRDSRVMPRAESLSLMRTMDRIRERWGLRYPGENGASGAGSAAPAS